MRKQVLATSLLFSTLILGGCASNGYAPYGYGNSGSWVHRHKNALGGAALGGAGGALIGGAVSGNGQGALVGGAVGAAVGGMVGNSMDNKAASRPYPYYGNDYR